MIAEATVAGSVNFYVGAGFGQVEASRHGRGFGMFVLPVQAFDVAV
jgi:hypothetical protein